MTESPTAVTWLPEARGCGGRHVAGGGVGVAPALAGARPTGDGADEGEGTAGTDRDSLLTRSPLATWRSSPPGAAAAGGRATP
jgi:hypothetical protein